MVQDLSEGQEGDFVGVTWIRTVNRGCTSSRRCDPAALHPMEPVPNICGHGQCKIPALNISKNLFANSFSFRAEAISAECLWRTV